MKYLLMIYADEKVHGKMTEADLKAMYGEYMLFTEQLKTNGQYLAGSQLQPVSSATSVRLRDGKRLVTDGPFAETREQLGGYYLVEATDLDEAIKLAERIPSARFGTVEVRPLVQAPAQARA